MPVILPESFKSELHVLFFAHCNILPLSRCLIKTDADIPAITSLRGTGVSCRSLYNFIIPHFGTLFKGDVDLRDKALRGNYKATVDLCARLELKMKVYRISNDIRAIRVRIRVKTLNKELFKRIF